MPHLPGDGPVRRRIDVAHVEREADDGRGASREWRQREQPIDCARFARFPREPGAHVNRQHASRGELVREQDGAVEAAREEDG